MSTAAVYICPRCGHITLHEGHRSPLPCVCASKPPQGATARQEGLVKAEDVLKPKAKKPGSAPKVKPSLRQSLKDQVFGSRRKQRRPAWTK